MVRIRWMTRARKIAWGQTAATESGKPVRPSHTAKKVS